MKTDENTLWTIAELGERVADALSGPGYEGVSSGRVRDVPDQRTIRYYTTLGLLDRPAAMRGRTALYGPRHLLQLVAIKRLQAQGLSLAAVQERVIGLSNPALRRLARAVSAGSQPHVSESRSESFWRLPSEPGPDADHRPSQSQRVQEIALADGLALSLVVERSLEAEDLRVIRMAAAPLIEILRLHGLIGIGPSPPNSGDDR
jgi:DNA-binding transcriptional MerR regulator